MDPSQFDLSLVPIVPAVFWIMTLFTLGGAIGVVTSKSLFHSALYLILSFAGVTGYYVLLSAGFLAVVQLMVYAGAIVILVLFAIMFSHKPMARVSQANRQWWLGLPVALVLFVVLLRVVGSMAWPVS
ncbi:MAG: NADH-quinone oxidoreductase subunit J, partial [Chloroflexota bacterium]